MAHLVFRPYDILADRDFLHAAHRETSAITFGAPFDDAKIDSELARAFEVREGLFLDGALVGLCDLDRRSTENLGDCGYVQFFYIAPAYRKAGLGGRLILHAADWCRRKGLCRLLLCTGKTNVAAQRCYEKYGFIRLPALDRGGEWAYVREVDGAENT